MTLDDYFEQPGAKSPSALADEVGVSESTLSRIRRGKQNTTREVIQKIIAATAGQVTADALIGVHELDIATIEHRPSATNGAENIRPFATAPEEVPARPSSGATLSTCSTTNEHPLLPLDSPASSTPGEAEAA